jgi:hypothetical protein
MKISRSNYEIWFIDLLDGNLSYDQIEQLNLFLADNQDIQEELQEMSELKINPPSVEFKGKAGIKKVPAEISDLQFEYLCEACLEKDLSEEELRDLSEIINSNPSRKNVFELFKKLKLTPPEIKFKNKKKLLQRTPFQKVIRSNVFSLSAAASVAILIVSYLFIPGNRLYRERDFSKLIVNEGRVINSPFVQQIKSEYPKEQKQLVKINNDIAPASVNKLTALFSYSDSAEKNIIETTRQIVYEETIHSAEILRYSDILPLYHTGIQNSGLIHLSLNNEIIDEQRWAVGRFFAKIFREKILKENTIDDSPIKGYEIAEAGVTGLNKLLGWEMAFEKNNDENGELKSIYFSSKILKVQAPVNKSEAR